jgi:hypothetical protein
MVMVMVMVCGKSGILEFQIALRYRARLPAGFFRIEDAKASVFFQMWGSRREESATGARPGIYRGAGGTDELRE